MSIGGRLLRIVGGRAAFTFGLVAFLVGALLATVSVTCRYAIKLYVEDQLKRTPWDVAVYQRTNPGQLLRLVTDRIATLQGVARVERVVFLRALFPESGEVVAEVDGRRTLPAWLSVLAASDLSILPPEVAFALGEHARDGAVLAMTGPQESSPGQAFLDLQGAKDFAVHVAMQDGRRGLFRTPIRSVIRLERDELQRWLMDQTGSPSYVPHVGLFLLMPYREDVLTRFDSVANGFLPLEMIDPNDEEEDHVQRAEYYPEVMYLAKVDRERLFSAWDIPGSLARMRDLHARIGWTVDLKLFTVDSTTEVLLERMQTISRAVGVLSLLVALPLLWMAWTLAGHLSALLMLNERRTLGLLRLRGIPGALLGRTFLLAIGGGGVLGATLGLVAGSVVPLLVYEQGRLPAGVLLDREQLVLSGMFLAIAVGLALLVSRRLVRYATTISPLEAARRVAASEAVATRVTFGPLQALALAVGGYVLVRWIAHYSVAPRLGPAAAVVEQLLDFAGIPLVLYGLARFLASRRALVERLIRPLVRPVAGALGRIVVQHVAVKPHRTVAFLLTVALMASVCLYPTITGGSFSNRAERGARVQVGADWQLIFNAPDIAGVPRLEGSIAEQLRMLQPGLERLSEKVRAVGGVTTHTYLVEAVLPRFYLPGYGLKGVPLYLLQDAAGYLSRSYSEPEVGRSGAFDTVLRRLAEGQVATSTHVTEFWELSPGDPVQLGFDARRAPISVPISGTLSFLPGLPPRTVTDRQGYVQARVDYLNHLFSSNSFVVAQSDNPRLQHMQVLIPRVILLVTGGDGTPDGLERRLLDALPLVPLEAHNLRDEVGKLGTDMYIALALANMRIYVVGGLLLAIIAIVAIGLTNYTEDRRTLGLLRMRGAAPVMLWRFLLAMLLSPALLGLALGAIVAVVAGFGLASHVWDLREIRTVVQYLPTRLVYTPVTAGVAVAILAMLVVVASAFSWWEYRKSAREQVSG